MISICRGSCASVQKAPRPQLVLGSFIGEIREDQQYRRRNPECHTNQFGSPPAHRPRQCCCEAAEKPTWPANPGDPPRTRFLSRSSERTVLRSPPHRIQNPYAHAQRRYNQQHPHRGKSNGDQNRWQWQKRENHQPQPCVQAPPLSVVIFPTLLHRPPVLP